MGSDVHSKPGGLLINRLAPHWLFWIVLFGMPGLPGAAALETMLTIEPTETYPRNSEGDIAVLKDGRLCLVYTQFYGGTSDHASANLAMRTSDDAGRTWTKLLSATRLARM